MSLRKNNENIIKRFSQNNPLNFDFEIIKANCARTANSAPLIRITEKFKYFRFDYRIHKTNQFQSHSNNLTNIV